MDANVAKKLLKNVVNITGKTGGVLAFSSTTTQSSVLFDAIPDKPTATFTLEIVSDANCFIDTAASAVAVADQSYRVVAGIPYTIEMYRGHTLAAISSGGTAAGGNLWWHQI